MHSRLLMLGAALPLVAVPLVLPSGVSQGAVTHAGTTGITGVTRTIAAGPAVAFPRPQQGTVGAPASPEINPAGPAEGDPADGHADAATKKALAKARGGFTFNRQVPGEARSGRPSRQHSSVIVRNGPQLRGSFHALDHFDSRTADNGNNFSNEPPDQGMCVGNGKVFESVNTAVQVYDKNGTGHGVTSLNRFYGLASAFVRPAGPFGPNVFDPSCVFDPQTKTFFQVADDLGVDPATGNLTGQALLDIAVTKHPLGKWQVYQLDVTDDGSNGTPVHDGCPCFGDYPHIGFDRNGFYIDTNEFSIFGPEFDGAQVYAFDKSELARGAATIHVTQFDTSGADQGNGGFTVWPAQSPSTGDFNRLQRRHRVLPVVQRGLHRRGRLGQHRGLVDDPHQLPRQQQPQGSAAGRQGARHDVLDPAAGGAEARPRTASRVPQRPDLPSAGRRPRTPGGAADAGLQRQPDAAGGLHRWPPLLVPGHRDRRRG